MIPPVRILSLALTTLLLMFGCGQNQSTEQARQTSTSAHNQAAPNHGGTPPPPRPADNPPAQAIPDFTFYILKSGIRFEKTDLKDGDTHVFVLFDPGCTTCQHEARDIGKNLDRFENTSFYFISMNDPGLMATFFERYAKELEGQTNVHLLYDRNADFINKFHIPNQFPATYIYDKNMLLKSHWNGPKSEGEIVAAITE